MEQYYKPATSAEPAQEAEQEQYFQPAATPAEPAAEPDLEPGQPQQPPTPMDFMHPGLYNSPYLTPGIPEGSKVNIAHNLAGYEWAGGTPAVAGGEIPVSRTDVSDAQMDPEWANLAQRERGLTWDKESIAREDAEIKRDARAQELAFIEARAAEKAERLAIEAEYVRRDRADLDEQFAKHRALISKGVDPWRSFDGGSPSGKISAALGVMTMTMAGPEYAGQGMALLENIISHEVSRQKYAIETQGAVHDNAYSRLRESLGDRDQAESALEALLMEGAKVKLEILKASTADAHIQANAQAQILEIDKRLLEMKADYERAARGKLAYHIQQAQAGTRGGWRYKKGLAAETAAAFTNISQTGLENAKTMKELSAPTQNAELLKSIPEATRTKLNERAMAIQAFDEIVRMLGANVDPETGKVIGEINITDDLRGVGFFSPVDPEMTQSPRAIELATKFKDAQDLLTVARRGASLTGTEQTRSDELMKSKTAEDTITKMLTLRSNLVDGSAALVMHEDPAAVDTLQRNYAANYKKRYGKVLPGLTDEK